MFPTARTGARTPPDDAARRRHGHGAYSAAIYEKTSLPPRVREVARLRIAAANGCPVCLNTRSAHATEDGFNEATVEAVVACDLGGVHTLGDLDERERLAGDSPTASRRIITDSTTRSWRTFASLHRRRGDRAHALCAMTLGNGRFFTVLGVEADDDGHYFVNEGER